MLPTEWRGCGCCIAGLGWPCPQCRLLPAAESNRVVYSFVAGGVRAREFGSGWGRFSPEPAILGVRG